MSLRSLALVLSQDWTVEDGGKLTPPEESLTTMTNPALVPRYSLAREYMVPRLAPSCERLNINFQSSTSFIRSGISARISSASALLSNLSPGAVLSLYPLSATGSSGGISNMEDVVDEGLVVCVGKDALSVEKVRMRPDHMFATVERERRGEEEGVGLGGGEPLAGSRWASAKGSVGAPLGFGVCCGLALSSIVGVLGGGNVVIAWWVWGGVKVESCRGAFWSDVAREVGEMCAVSAVRSAFRNSWKDNPWVCVDRWRYKQVGLEWRMGEKMARDELVCISRFNSKYHPWLDVVAQHYNGGGDCCLQVTEWYNVPVGPLVSRR